MTTAQLVDCTHLHSAFGPGCPYCWRPPTRREEDKPGPRVPGPASRPRRPGLFRRQARQLDA